LLIAGLVTLLTARYRQAAPTAIAIVTTAAIAIRYHTAISYRAISY
jgi:hypothetical protein